MAGRAAAAFSFGASRSLTVDPTAASKAGGVEVSSQLLRGRLVSNAQSASSAAVTSGFTARASTCW